MEEPRLQETLRRLERTLVNEGGIIWRNSILDGGAADFAWPAELPMLTPDLTTWFSWHNRSDGRSIEYWRSASWAADQYRANRSNPAYRASLVPVLEDYFVDTEDGSVWARGIDDEGADRFDRAPSFADLSELLASIESKYAARRHSPWRRFRIDRPDRGPWRTIDLPDALSLAEALVGTGLLLAPTTGRWPRGQLLLKVAPATWLAMPMRIKVPHEDSVVDDLVTWVRSELAAGEDVLETDSTDQAAAERLASQKARLSARGPVVLLHGVVRVWQAPPVSDLLTRLDRELGRVAPDVRRALSPPARPEDVAALEERLGVELPPDLRALWAFADGQSALDSVYWRHRLMSVAQAQNTIETMLGLASDQFGEEYWKPAFVPFLDAGNGDHLCVDVAGDYGPEGCVCDFDHNWPERREILFGGVAEWLECFVDGLEAGIYIAAPDGGLFPRDFVASGSFAEITAHNEARTNGRYPWVRSLRMRPGSTSRS